jgi:hypothetical protein
MTFTWHNLLKRVSQLNDGIGTPTFLTTDAIISNRLHRLLVTFDLWQKLTDFRIFGIPKSATGGIQGFLHATAFATFAKGHSPIDFMQSGSRAFRYSCLNQRHPLAPAHV